MNDEIKEKKTKRIIEKIEGLATYVTIPRELAIYNVNIDSQEAKLLIDYITNLKQENEDNLKCIKSIKEQLESVIDENQRLLKQWFENNDKIVELISEKEVYYDNFKDYKSRCEKAVEYIKNCPEYLWANVNTKVLLNILNGRSDE